LREVDKALQKEWEDKFGLEFAMFIKPEYAKTGLVGGIKCDY